MTDLEHQSEPTDYYWAAEPDTEKLVNFISTRRDKFFEYLYGSGYFERIDRNWKYYHGLFYEGAGSVSGKEIKVSGEKGENALIAVNHFRSVLHMLHTYAVQNRPAWDTKAANSDYRSMQQAKLGNDILDYYMDQKGVEEFYRRAIEEALIFAQGFVKITWDDQQGEPVAADPQAMQLYQAGDVSFENPTVFDVFYDCTARRWDDSRWVGCRSFKNKWELISQYPEATDALLGYDVNHDYQFKDYRREHLEAVGIDEEFTDLYDFWEFWHEDSKALPGGRYTAFVGDTPLIDGPLPPWCKRKPVYRVTPAPYLLNAFGYTPAFDLQGPQEALNSEVSTIVTNHKNLGPTKIWVKTGETIGLADLEPGVSVFQTDTEPKPINLTQTPREFFEFINVLNQHIEYISGMNAVARGQPQESLRSGTSLALVDQKAMQYASVLQASAYRLLGDMGTATLEILKNMATTPRVIYIAGVNRRSELREFQAKDLMEISRVTVQVGNPLAKTIAGRKEIAAELLQNGLVRTPEEYLSVLETGQLRPLTESDDAQLNVAREENETLRNGGMVQAMITDFHTFHIRKHQAILDSTEMRTHPIIAPNVSAHILEHLQFLLNPQAQMLQTVLRYDTPLPALLAGAPPQSGQSQPQTPAPEANQGNVPPQATDQAKSAAMESNPVR